MGWGRRWAETLAGWSRIWSGGPPALEAGCRETIADIEQTLADAETRLAASIAAERRLTREVAANTADALRHQARAETAVRAGDDLQACTSLQRQLEHDQLARRLRDQLAHVRTVDGQLQRELNRLRADLLDIKKTFAQLVVRNRNAEARRSLWSRRADLPAELPDLPAIDFRQLEQEVVRLEAEAEALHELQAQAPADEPASAPEADLDSALSRLKQQVSAQQARAN